MNEELRLGGCRADDGNVSLYGSAVKCPIQARDVSQEIEAERSRDVTPQHHGGDVVRSKAFRNAFKSFQAGHILL